MVSLVVRFAPFWFRWVHKGRRGLVFRMGFPAFQAEDFLPIDPEMSSGFQSQTTQPTQEMKNEAKKSQTEGNL